MKTEDHNTKALLWSHKLVGLDSDTHNNTDQLMKALVAYLNELIAHDFNKLIAILYRIDVTQEKATSALTAQADRETPGETLAKLIIERQLQKLKFREKFKNK